MDYIHILKRCDLFRNVGETNIEAILKAVSPKIKSYEKGETVLKADMPVKDFFIVLEGRLGGEYLGAVRAGKSFGIRLASSGLASPCNVMAEECTEIMLISYKKLIKCSGSDMPFFYRVVENIVKTVSEENIYLNERLRILSKTTLKNKLLEFFRLQSRTHGDNILSLSMSRLDIANYLCVDRCSLSRELTKLKKEDYIDIDKQKIILRPKCLQECLQ